MKFNNPTEIGAYPSPALAERALGFYATVQEEIRDPDTGKLLQPRKDQYFPPEPSCIFFTLKNRKKDEYRESTMSISLRRGSNHLKNVWLICATASSICRPKAISRMSRVSAEIAGDRPVEP